MQWWIPTTAVAAVIEQMPIERRHRDFDIFDLLRAGDSIRFG
jgi:hypothetical protein